MSRCKSRCTSSDGYIADNISLCSGIGNRPENRLANSEKNDLVDINKQRFKVVPIPATSFAQIESITEGEVVMLFDLLGNLLYQERATKDFMKINLSNLPPAIYIIKVGNRIPEKIIKSNEPY